MTKLFQRIVFIMLISLTSQAETLLCAGRGFALMPYELGTMICRGLTSQQVFKVDTDSESYGVGVKIEGVMLDCPGLLGDQLLGYYEGGRGQFSILGGASAGYIENKNGRCYTVGVMAGYWATISVSGMWIQKPNSATKNN